MRATGLHWGAYEANEPDRVRDVFRALFRLYAPGQIAPVISERFPLEEVPKALDALASRQTCGKVIVAP